MFEFTAEFPRTGMCTTQKSSTNQGPRVRILIHIMHTGHIMTLISRKLSSKYICLIRPCCLWSFRSQGSFFSYSTHHVGFPLLPFTDLLCIGGYHPTLYTVKPPLRLHSLCIPQGDWGWGEGRISICLEIDKGGLPKFLTDEEGGC